MTIITDKNTAVTAAVTVSTTARLHMGFYDLTQSAQQFGGLGLAIDTPSTLIKLEKSELPLISCNYAENVVKIIQNLQKAFNVPSHIALEISQNMPQHAGFGSGTQLALALGAGLNQLFGLNLSVAQIAAATGRGKRSQIGIAAFEHGGFLVDAGKHHTQAGLANRVDFPPDWRVLLVQDSARMGVHGTVESSAFAQLAAAKLSLKDQVFNELVPALQAADLLAFGAVVRDIQSYNGGYFSPIQGGMYASEDVAAVLSWLQNNGATCVGQSSWGPTGFAVLESQQQAEALQLAASKAFEAKRNMSFSICRGKNSGAVLE